MNAPATIVCTEQLIDDVPATGAKLYVSVSGDKFFTGKAALKQAVQVRKLIKRLAAEGVTDDAISLSAVQVDVSKGLFSRSSSARYLLCVSFDELDFLSGILDAISDQKNCQLGTIDWKYDNTEDHKTQWLGRCIASVQKKAAAMASALGVTLGEVVHAAEETLGEPKLDDGSHHQHGFATCDTVSVRKRASFGSVSEALSTGELAPSREMGVRVTISYRIISQ